MSDEKQYRRFDDLGRIAIPRDFRKELFGTTKTEGVRVEVSMEDNKIIIQIANDSE